MNLSRIFANAFARKIAAVVVALVLAWLGVGQVRAQTADCTVPSYTCAKPVALAQCQAFIAPYGAVFICEDAPIAGSPNGRYIARVPAGSAVNNFFYGAPACAVGQEYNPATGQCQVTCASRTGAPTLFEPPGGSFGCSSGCVVKYTAMGLGSDGKMHTMRDYTGAMCGPDNQKADCDARNPPAPAPPSYVYNKFLGVCQPVTVECQDGHSPKQGICTLDESCPTGMILNAKDVCIKESNDCPSGETKAPDGTCLNEDEKNSCGTGKAKGKDGTCKKDANDDGTPDDEEGNEDGDKFSGGDNCDVPPSCSGDVIACGQARIQWRIECNTRKNSSINGGSCSSMPVCAGAECRPVEMAMLWQQWKAACELEKLNAKTTGEGGDGATAVPGTPDYDVTASTQAAAGDAGEGGDGADGVFTDESANNDGQGGVPGGTGELDTDGLGWSRGCPSIPSVDVFGTTVAFDIGPICDWIQLGGMIVLVMSALVSLRILTSSI